MNLDIRKREDAEEIKKFIEDTEGFCERTRSIVVKEMLTQAETDEQMQFVCELVMFTCLINSQIEEYKRANKILMYDDGKSSYHSKIKLFTSFASMSVLEHILYSIETLYIGRPAFDTEISNIYANEKI